jgi:iron-sulfur cluster assembly protein CyaY
MNEQDFKTRAGDSLDALYQKLATASDEYDFEPDFNNGALTIEFEEPKAKFVVSPNAPVRQIWISAHSRSFKLDWDAAREAFVLPGTGQTLNAFIEGAISTHLGQTVKLG